MGGKPLLQRYDDASKRNDVLDTCLFESYTITLISFPRELLSGEKPVLHLRIFKIDKITKFTGCQKKVVQI